MKKIGLLCMALVIAVGGLGIGYAAWIDTIYIEGTVDTGSVDINVVGYSSTFVYKVPGLEPDEIVINHVAGSVDPDPPTGGTLIASAVAVPAVDIAGALIDDAVTITYTNLFPCVDFWVDILLHYDGSIPVRVKSSVIDISVGDPALVALWGMGPQSDGTGAWIEFYQSNAAGEKIGTVSYDPTGWQLHHCNYILVLGHIHLPQDPILMGLNSEFTATFEVIQWNEAP